jgi:hypothetical protein
MVIRITDLKEVTAKMQNLSNAKKAGIIFATYVFLTVILTYPVAFKIGSEVPGGGDAFQWMFVLWYTGYALMHPNITTLNHNNLWFYPDGISTMPFPSAFNQLLYHSMSPFFELHVIYTLLWLLTFIVGAFGAYLLVKYLTGNGYAAFISGIVFAFTPYHFVHALGHFGATSIEWIPFCALYLMKTFREGGTRNSILSGGFFILVAMSDLQYMVFMGLFAMLLCLYDLYWLLANEKEKVLTTIETLIRKYLPFGLVSFAGILPFTINDIFVATSGSNFLKPNHMEAVTYSTDLLSFFLPCQLHPFLGDLVAPIYSNFSGNLSEHTTYIGYAVLLLSVFVFLKLRSNKEIKFWLLSAVLFSLLSLGPLLSINGQTVFTIFNTTVPLPHLVLYYLIPFLDNCRTTGRFFVVAALAFAVLAGYGITELLKKDIPRKKLFVILISAVIIFEYMCIPYPTSTVEQPEFYQGIAQEKGYFALIEIPATKNYGAGIMAEYYQTIHGKPIVGGQVARTPQGARDFEMNTPLINEITYIKPINDILNQNTMEVGTSILNHYNIRYIVIHRSYLKNEDIQFLLPLINQTINNTPKVYGKDSIIVYQADKTPKKMFMAISDGWNALETWNDGPGRWMRKDAGVIIYSPENQDCTLSFEVGSLHTKRDLSVYVNNEVAGTYDVCEIGYPDVTPEQIGLRVHLKKGENVLRFVVSQPGTVPSEIGAWNDSRELSLAFQNITII